VQEQKKVRMHAAYHLYHLYKGTPTNKGRGEEGVSIKKQLKTKRGKKIVKRS
jgi:hypothetical protein